MKKVVTVLTNKASYGSIFVTKITGILQKAGIIQNTQEIEFLLIGTKPFSVGKQRLESQTSTICYAGIKCSTIPDYRKSIDQQKGKKESAIEHIGLWVMEANLSLPGIEGVILFNEEQKLIKHYADRQAA